MPHQTHAGKGLVDFDFGGICGIYFPCMHLIMDPIGAFDSLQF
jgi:hypothetical protein